MVRKIMIIGCGGIGSYLIPLLDKTGLYSIKVYDPDIIEKKNISYQNFYNSDIDLNKAEVFDKRYESVKGQPYLVLTSKQMKGYDLVVCCADNIDVRKTLYLTKGIKWLDLRAQGRAGVLLSYLENPDLFVELSNGPAGSFSCQGNDWEGKKESLHFIHVAVAGVGAEWIQRWFNEEQVFKHKLVNA
jgi:molybdopterin/thiamine biosynthesis adenylyltransferase